MRSQLAGILLMSVFTGGCVQMEGADPAALYKQDLSGGVGVVGDVFEELFVPGDFDTIQEAIDNAEPGNIITVAPGVYQENLKIIEKDLVIRSAEGPADTIIQSGRRGGTVIFISQTTTAFTLRGFTVTGGFATVGGGIRIEAGLGKLEDLWITGNEASEAGGLYIHNAAPEIHDLLIYDNEALLGDGGGVLFDVSSAIMTNTEVFDNTAAGLGGGICMSSAYPVLQNVQVEGNDANHGGGIALVDSIPVMTDSEIVDNNAVGDGGGLYSLLTESPTTSSMLRVRFEFNQAGGKGGGLYSLGAALLMSAVDFVDNSANFGGGAYVSTSVFTLLSNVRFSDNYAVTDGGGLNFRSTDSALISNLQFSGNLSDRYGGGFYGTAASAGMKNLTFSGNYGFAGGGLYLYRAQPEVENCSFLGNRAVGGLGGGLYYNEPTDATLTNSLMAYNRGGSNKENVYVTSGGIVSSYNAFYVESGSGITGAELGETDIVTEPSVFNDPTDGNLSNDDYHLELGSLLIDAGNPARAFQDPDGSANDIGSFGGGGADRWDLDGDGYFQWWNPAVGYEVGVHDCDDLNAEVNPEEGCD